MMSTTETIDGVAVLRLDGAMNLDGAREFKDQMQAIRKTGVDAIVVDFSKVDMCQSQVLQHLTTPIRAFSMLGGKIAFCCMNDSVHKVLKTGMMFSMVDVYDDVESAIEELA